MIQIPSAEFSEAEELVLGALYSVSDGSYSVYSLASHLNPDVGPDAAVKAFKEVQATIEGLIARSIVKGKRLTGADGVYFESLGLTTKGERKAIESKNRPRRLTVTHIGVDESED